MEYTKAEIEQKIKELKTQPAEEKTSIFTHWSAWLMYGALVWLGIEFLLKIKTIKSFLGSNQTLVPVNPVCPKELSEK